MFGPLSTPVSLSPLIVDLNFKGLKCLIYLFNYFICFIFRARLIRSGNVSEKVVQLAESLMMTRSLTVSSRTWWWTVQMFSTVWMIWAWSTQVKSSGIRRIPSWVDWSQQQQQLIIVYDFHLLEDFFFLFEKGLFVSNIIKKCRELMYCRETHISRCKEIAARSN